MAKVTAREVAQRLVDIQRVRGLYLHLVTSLRDEAIKSTAEALVRRYHAHQKRQQKLYPDMPEQPFHLWLAHKVDLEHTFWHRGTGASLPVRRRWAIQYYEFLTRKELTFDDDPMNLWVAPALEAELNRRAQYPDCMIVAEVKSYPAIPSRKVKEGNSFHFSLKKREGAE